MIRLRLDVLSFEHGRRVARSFPLELCDDSAIQGIRIYGPEGLIYSDLFVPEWPGEATMPTTPTTDTTPTTPTTH